MDDDPVTIIKEMVAAQAVEFDALSEWLSAWWEVSNTERTLRAYAIAKANVSTSKLLAAGKRAAVWEDLYEHLND